MRMTALQLDMIRARVDALNGIDVWADGDEIGDQVREDFATLLYDVDLIRVAGLKPTNEMTLADLAATIRGVIITQRNRSKLTDPVRMQLWDWAAALDIYEKAAT